MLRFPCALLLALLASYPLGATDSPEISVLRDSVEILDNATDTVYGAVAGSPLTITYVIANTGALPLTIGSPVTVTAGGNTAVSVTQPSATVASHATTSLIVQVTATSAGAWSFTVTFSTDDSNENPTNWTASGMAVAVAVPQVSLKRGATSIADGSSDTVSGLTRTLTEQVTYTVTNVGSAVLTTSSLHIAGVSTGCIASISGFPAASVAVGASTSLVIAVQPSAATWSCDVAFTSNDSAATTFDWTMTGSAVLTAPEIQVLRNGVVINTGGIDSAPGGTAGSPIPGDLTYTVANVGNISLTLGAPSYSNLVHCSLLQLHAPLFSVGVTSSTTFAVQIIPDSNAAWSVNVSLPNDDANESPTTWTIRGTATAGGSGGDIPAAGAGGCGAGSAVTGMLLIILAALGLRRQR